MSRPRYGPETLSLENRGVGTVLTSSAKKNANSKDFGTPKPSCFLCFDHVAALASCVWPCCLLQWLDPVDEKRHRGTLLFVPVYLKLANLQEFGPKLPKPRNFQGADINWL